MRPLVTVEMFTIRSRRLMKRENQAGVRMGRACREQREHATTQEACTHSCEETAGPDKEAIVASDRTVGWGLGHRRRYWRSCERAYPPGSASNTDISLFIIFCDSHACSSVY
jgi:hypothetical protein